MLAQKTVLILGAGASKTFGLPLGQGLKDVLSNKLEIRFDDRGTLKHGSSQIVDCFRLLAREHSENPRDISRYTRASREISDAMPVCPSIDDYIERHAGHKEYEICAKLGIAESILEAERQCPLHLDLRNSNTVNLSQYGSSWISQFLQMITRGIHRKEIGSSFKYLKVIIFNYDRCFEQFVFYWLQQVYKISPDESSDIVNKIDIVHPYGSLGDIFGYPTENQVPFGADIHAGRLISISNTLKTYSESSSDASLSLPIKQYVHDCRTFVFLGFAFHQQNMNLLKCPPSNAPFARRVFATTVQISAPRWETIRDRLSNTFDISSQDLFTHTDNESCESLISEYSDNIFP